HYWERVTAAQHTVMVETETCGERIQQCVDDFLCLLEAVLELGGRHHIKVREQRLIGGNGRNVSQQPVQVEVEAVSLPVIQSLPQFFARLGPRRADLGQREVT